MGDAEFWDRIAEKYARDGIADEASYERKLEETRAYLTPESRVLEIGCGTGSTALRHAPHAGHILATDISGEMIAIARGKAEGVENVEFRVARIEEIDVPDASVDMVMAHSVLHLVRDVEGTLDRAVRWLRPGGVLVTSTACLGGWRRLPIRLLIPVMRAVGKAPFVNAFSEDTLVRRVEAAGFRVERRWTPERPMAAMFLIARKPGEGARLAA